ncbi:zinc finger protein 436-like [Centropristis striata]|uniref:zinc finger protein 436-like n=1 Tax=Centropristis striata TaxID=184440 RepID=UPI0027E0827B|nr:zinc finger protein 436-like [Centropristis striata]
MSTGTQLLRLLLNERLAAAAEEIFGLVEKTIAEYQDEAVRSKREVIQLKKQIEQLTVLKPQVTLFRADSQLVSEERPPALQHHHIKMEEIRIVEIQVQSQVKEEQVDECISPDMEAVTCNDAEMNHKTPATNCELLPSPTTEGVIENKSVDDYWNEGDGSLSPHQSYSVEVFVDQEQPLVEDRTCCFCGESYKKDCELIRHVAKSHKGHKAFKCMECNKEFKKRSHFVVHKRIHTGEKPFSCDYCDKTFNQNSSRLAHMRVHTGERPYYCKKCGRSFTTSKHLKICKMQDEHTITPGKRNEDEDHKEMESVKSFELNTTLERKQHYVQHNRVLTAKKHFNCDFC